MKDKRSKFRCSGCINNIVPIDQPCPYVVYSNSIGNNQSISYYLCYKSSENKFIVTNSCNLCKYYEKFNCASGFCRHPSFKQPDGTWKGLYIQFPERIHEDCPLPDDIY